MKNFRIIRFAITLSLIVTMMTQPMVAAAFAGGCGDSGCQHHAKPLCEGCGCCEVADAGESCCFCSGKQDDAKQNSEDVDPASHSDSLSAITAKPQVLKGVCLCGLTNPPMNRGSERERMSEQTEVRDLAIVFVQPDDADGLSRQPVAPISLAATGKVPRFSQRLLCVWRI